MKYKYYGTGSYEGAPSMWCDCVTCKEAMERGGKNIRSRSQQTVDDKILIDFPPDTFMHFINGLPLQQIHTCIVTHNHSDHFYPEDIVQRFGWYVHEIEDDIPFEIYSMQPAIEQLDKIMKIEEGAVNATPDRVKVHEITPFKTFIAEDYRITPLNANHDKAAGSVIFLIEKDGKAVLHANDTGYFTEDTWQYLSDNVRHIDLASFDCTECGNYPNIDKLSGHMNYATVKNVRKKLQDLGFINENTICVLNHISPKGNYNYDEFQKFIGNDGFIIAYDGLEIEF